MNDPASTEEIAEGAPVGNDGTQKFLAETDATRIDYYLPNLWWWRIIYRFRKIDRNGDGCISFYELYYYYISRYPYLKNSKWFWYYLLRLFKRIDTDGNWCITLREYLTYYLRYFIYIRA